MIDLNANELRSLLEKVKNSDIQIDDAVNELKKLPFEDIDFAKIDFHRELRHGYPEIILCEGKKVDHIQSIARRLLDRGRNLVATRAGPDVYGAIRGIAADAVYYDTARIVSVRRQDIDMAPGIVAVVTAGTSDIPVAEEAAVTLELMGNRVRKLYDVGVAGIHRLFANTSVLLEADVVIVVAGMDGALASVVGGLIDKPVVAVPTSVGYGASFGGLSALLAMLNSCAGGIGVVNIDNGFGAGYLAARINRCIYSYSCNSGNSGNPSKTVKTESGGDML